MGGFEVYCCFCAGPFYNARQEWLNQVRNWENNPDLSFTPPPAPKEDIVTITEDDGEFWEDFVCVGEYWDDSFVSPKGFVEDDFGGIAIDDSSEWQETAENYLVIHRQCLSFLTRRINATPKQIWESLFIPQFGHDVAAGHPNFLLEYYNMEERNQQCFGFAIEKITPRLDDPERFDYWADPSSMKDLQWILARPGIFPLVKPLSVAITPSTSSPRPVPPYMKVLQIPELFDLILDAIITGYEIVQKEVLEHEIEAESVFTLPSITEATHTIFSLLQVNKQFYVSIVRDRQDVFLRLAWEHGWMLPSTPWEWKNWQNGTFHNGTSFIVVKDADWKTYLLSFLRKEDVHIKNRWRFHRMTLQFVQGRGIVNQGGRARWRWSIGEGGVRTDTTSPEPLAWEKC